MPDVLIDLGEDWATPAPVQPVPGDPRRDRRRWLLVLALLPALALTGAARPRQPFREVASVPAGTQVFALTAVALDAVESAGPDASTVAAYPVAGGLRQWRATVPGPVTDLRPHPRSGVLLALNPVADSAQPEAASSIVESVSALDQTTGRLLWSARDAQLVGLRPDSRLAVLLLPDGPGRTQLVGADLRSGRAAWRLPLHANPVVGMRDPADSGPARLAVLDGDTLTLLDEATGTVLASLAAGVPATDARDDTRPPRLYLIGALAVVAYEDHFRTVLAGYGLAGLAPRWRTTMPTETSFLAGCGPVLCAGTGLLITCFPVRCSEIDSYLYGLDAGTATVRWVSQGWSRTGGPLPAGREVIAYNRDMPGNLTARDGVIDPTTGRTLLDLGRWYPVIPAEGTGTVFVGRRSDSYHSWLALLRVAGGAGTVPLGQLPVAAEACESAAAYLACPTLDRRVTVWRYPG